MSIYDLITCRHSERKFTDKVISKEDLEKIIDAGLSAPSGGNSQPWYFTVIKDKKTQQKLVSICKEKFIKFGADWRKKWAQMDNFNPFYDPNIIIVISNHNGIEQTNEDCCFAIQNMVLMAEGLGLSSCIIRDICWAIDKTNQDQFGIPEDYDCFMCISLGYAYRKNAMKKQLDLTKVNYIE